MINTSSAYIESILKNNRTFTLEIKIGDRVLTQEHIISFDIESSVGDGDILSIGSVCSSKLKLKLIRDYPAPEYFTTQEIKIKIGLLLENKTWEWLNLGTFYPDLDSVKKTKKTIEIECFDKMALLDNLKYSSALTFPALTSDLLKEINIKYSLPMSSNLLSNNRYIPGGETISKEFYDNTLSKGSLRQALAYFAITDCANYIFDENGILQIKYINPINYAYIFTNRYSGENTIDFKLLIDDKAKYSKLICIKEGKVKDPDTGGEIDAKNLEAGDNTGYALSFKDDNMLYPDYLMSLYNYANLPFEFYSYELKGQGLPQAQPGDYITYKDVTGNFKTLYIVTHKLSYSGGLISTFTSKAPNKSKGIYTPNINISGNSGSSSSGGGSGAYQDLAIIKELLAGNITADNIKANSITAQCLDVKYATFEEFTAGVGRITTLEADFATINTLINGNLTSANIHSLTLTSSKVTVEDAFIKNAMIDTVNAAKINGGVINTNLLKIGNDKMLLSGATQQFIDNNKIIRIQIGEDKSGNFSFVLRDGTGKGVLIDETGIKEGAISDDLIKSNMIAEDAVGSKQIDYNSFTTGFNADTNTNYLKSSRVQLDGTEQTLDVVFNALNTTVADNIEKINANTTSISTQQGQIKGLISNTTITKENGETVSLKDDYTSLVATVDGINTTVGSHTSSLDGVSSRLATVEQTASGLTTTVTDTIANLNNNYKTKEELDALIGEDGSLTSDIDSIKTKQTQLIQDAESFKFRIDTVEKDKEATSVKSKIVTIDETGLNVGEDTDKFSSNLDDTGLYLKSFGVEQTKFSTDGAEIKDLKITGTTEMAGLKINKVSVSGEARTHIHFIG